MTKDQVVFRAWRERRKKGGILPQVGYRVTAAVCLSSPSRLRITKRITEEHTQQDKTRNTLGTHHVTGEWKHVWLVVKEGPTERFLG